jgi:hypothetical protein
MSAKRTDSETTLGPIDGQIASPKCLVCRHRGRLRNDNRRRLEAAIGA